MSVVAPPPQDELEALIREARARQRKRWLGGAALIAVLAGATLGLYSITNGTTPNTSSGAGGPTAGVKTGKACRIRVAGARILDGSGRTVFREPGHWTHPNGGPPAEVRCSGSTIWVVWDNGAGMMKEAYVGVRSSDGGQRWRLVFSNPFFGVKARHTLDAYLGPWTLRGTREAFFTGWCPACSKGAVSGSTSLWSTTDGGRTFHWYRLPALLGYEPTGVRVSRRSVTISAKGFFRGTWRRKTVTVPTA